MTNNSDGLTPTLRPQLGIGWNRALPSAFGFDKCIQGDGVNDYLEIPRMVGYRINHPITIEFFMKASFNNVCSMVGLNNENLTRLNLDSRDFGFVFDGRLYHIVVTIDPITGNMERILNSDANGYVTMVTGSASVQTYANFNLSLFRILAERTGTEICKNKIDEFRVYNKKLSLNEIALNYNGGIGSNPCVTENLMMYYKFEEFEMLDFSVLQDGSDLRLGVRDFSGKTNHAQPINMDTNSASGTYVLKSF